MSSGSPPWDLSQVTMRDSCRHSIINRARVALPERTHVRTRIWLFCNRLRLNSNRVKCSG